VSLRQIINFFFNQGSNVNVMPEKAGRLLFEKMTELQVQMHTEEIKIWPKAFISAVLGEIG